MGARVYDSKYDDSKIDQPFFGGKTVIDHSGPALLLDIEGTTSSAQYVYGVMIPFAIRELECYLDAHWGNEDIASVCEYLSVDPTDEWGKEKLRDAALALMQADSKTTGVKKLQGLIWRSGFESGELKSHIYDEVPGALHDWNAAGCEIRIYSAGSIAAQKLFFANSIYGDLLSTFKGHYDTTIGSKREVASYSAIAADWELPPQDILFVSDIVAELDAAKGAGLATVLCVRDSESPSEPHSHAEITDFRQIHLIAAHK